MKLKSVQLARAALRPADFPRDGRPEAALMGRSNVGKSSLLNRLVGRKAVARVSKSPGRTRALHFYAVDERFYLVDLPGFGYAKVSAAERRGWARLVESYLERGRPLALAVHLVDGRHEPTPLDRQLTDSLTHWDVPFVVALTKTDKLSGSQVPRALSRARRVLELAPDAPLIPTSAHDGRGIRDLLRLILAATADARSTEGRDAAP